MTQQDQRSHLRSLMELFVDHRTLIGYQASRPMQNLHFYEADWVSFFKAKGPQHLMDCSEAVTILCHMAGLKDPTGFGYTGDGNSATMTSHLSHFTNPLHTMSGTIVTFGNGGVDHAAMVYSGGQTDPLLWSHGTAAGPEFVNLSGFASEFSTHTFCSVGTL